MMMRVSELVAMARSLREDGSSPIADAAGARYGITRTRFVRSSAAHVFWAGTGPTDGDLDRVLRLRPATGAGGDYDAEVWERIRGEVLQLDELTSERLRAWGRTLRLFHLGGAVVAGPARPDWFSERVVPAARALGLRRVEEAMTRLDALPRDAARWGRVHGDPEPDNLVWRDASTPVLVDLDEVTTAWFGADVCFALRDIADEGAAPEPDDHRVQELVAGYAATEALLPEAWPDFSMTHAAVAAHRLAPVVAEPVEPDWPAWARELHARVSVMRHTLLRTLA